MQAAETLQERFSQANCQKASKARRSTIMKITEALKTHQHGHFSFEFFPPKTEMGLQNLHTRLERMAKWNPLFVAVTWGASGSTAAKSLALAIHCQQQQLHLNTCLHLTCTNTNEKEVIDEALFKAKGAGIRNILALRGDPPRCEEYFGTTSSEFCHAIDLVRYIRKIYGDYFCIGVACYPEGHAEGSVPERQNVNDDLPFLVEKVKAGADFLVTQLFYDAEALLSFERNLREHTSGIFTSIPIIPGLMPINSYSAVRRISKLAHSSLTPNLSEKLEAIKADDQSVKTVGVHILCEIIYKILQQSTTHINHFHFYTLNLEKTVALVLAKCGFLEHPDALCLASR